MKLKTINSAKDAGILGIEFVSIDKSITEIIIGTLHIRKGESYQPGLQVLVEAPFEEVSKFRATARIEGFKPTVGYFDSEYEARAESEALESKGATIEIASVKCHVNDAGEIVGEGAASIIGDDTSIPF